MKSSLLNYLTLAAALACGALNPRPAAAQTISYTGGTHTENFDSMGPTGTNLPPGWFVGYAGASIFSPPFFPVVPSDGSIAANGNAGWNFGVSGASDRVPGTMATSTGTPTPPAATRYLEARFRNNSGFPFTNVTVFYDGEQWRTGSTTTDTNTLVLQVSGDGVNFVNMGAAFNFTQPTFTPLNSALDGNEATNRAPGRGGTYPLASPLAPAGTLFLRWFDANEPGADPALATDNFSFSANAVLPPPTLALTSVAPLTGPPGANVTATASVTNGSGQVDFYLDGQFVFQDAASPFTVTYANLTAGMHTLAAVAYGSGGVRATSAPVIVTITNEPGFTYLVPNGSTWKYLDDGSDQGTNWRAPDFIDSGWSNGVAELGFGDTTENPPRPERTVINGGPATNRIVTTYFRHTFTVPNPAAYSNVIVRLLRDDGSVAYLNGVEVFRSNIDPVNPIHFDTLTGVNAPDDGTTYFDSTNLSPALLVAGPNLLAVEIHQSALTSSDLSFDAMLLAQAAPPPPCAPPPTGLTSWWPGEGNANDLAGANHGAIQGSVSFGPGRVGSAFKFNGSTSWVDFGTGPSITGQGPFAVEAWIQTTQTTVGAILQQRSADEFNGQYQLWLVDGRISWYTYGDFEVGFAVGSSRPVNDGSYHHIVATREADGTGKLYIDGSLDSSQAAPPRTLVPIRVYTGADVRDHMLTGESRFFIGTIDELSIYNRAPSPSEIAGLYAAGSTGKCGGAPPVTPATGTLLRKVYRGIPGNFSVDLTSHSKFINDQPDEVTYVSSFEDTTPSDTNSINENFGVQLSGFLIAPVTGNYDFFIAGDNESTLYLSTDESPAHKVLIAREPEWNVQRDWLGTDRRDTNAPQNRSTTLFPGGLPLVAGRQYYIEALSKEGEGGNHVSVTWKVPGEPAVTNGTPPIPGIGTFINLAGTHTNLSATPLPNTLFIVYQPQSQCVAAGQRVTFSVVALGNPAPTYQWKKNGTIITAAFSSTFTIPVVSSADAAGYTVEVSNSAGTIVSAVATLTVGLAMTNPSFEVDTFTIWPGYMGDNAPITGWTSPGGHGINPVAGANPFADNGVVPHGAQVAFLQEDGSLRQTVSGFTVGAPYYVQYYENARAWNNGTVPFLEVQIGGGTIVGAHPVAPVGGANPYRQVVSETFTASVASLELAFIKSNPQGDDTTALLDNVCIVQIPSNSPPLIVAQPRTLVVTQDTAMVLTASVAGEGLQYRWFFADLELAGYTNATLFLRYTQPFNAGEYTVRVSNQFGEVATPVAAVTVIPVPTAVGEGFLKDMENNPDANFFKIKREGEAFFQVNTNSIGEEAGPKMRFERYCLFFGPRVNLFGSLGPGSAAMVNYWQKSQAGCVCPSPVPSNWQNLGPFSLATQNSGIMNCLYVDPNNQNYILAGSYTAGLWKTTDGGVNWSCITGDACLPAVGAASVTVQPNSGNMIMYVGTGARTSAAGVIKTTDGGLTWTKTGLTFPPSQQRGVGNILIHPVNPNILYTLANYGGPWAPHVSTLFKSTDGGVTWSQLPPPPGLGTYDKLDQLLFSPSNPNVVYAAGTKVMKWTDTPPSWTDLTFPGGLEVGTMAFTPADPGKLYLMYIIPGNTATWLRKIHEGGGSWGPALSLNAGGPCGYFDFLCGGFGYWCRAFAISPVNKDVMYTGGTIMWKSVNGGVSFFPITAYFPPQNAATHPDVRAIHLWQGSANGANDVIYIATDGGISKTVNGGQTWANIDGLGPNGISANQFYGLAGYQGQPNLVVGGTQDNGAFENSSGNWRVGVFVGGIGDAYDGAIDLFNPNRMYIEQNGNGLSLSVNGGASWQCAPSPAGARKLDGPLLFHRNNVLYAGYHDVWFQEASGSWKQISDFTAQFNVDPGGPLVALDVAPSDTNYIYAAFDGVTYGGPVTKRIFRTTDSGTTWQDITAGFNPVAWWPITDLKMDPRNPNRVWVTCGAFAETSPGSGVGFNRVWAGFWNGSSMSWYDFSQGLPEVPVNCIVYEEGSTDGLYVGTDVGVYYHNLYPPANQWVCFNNNLPNILVSDLEINYCSRTIKAATFGRGIWESPLAPNTLGVRPPEVISTSATWPTDRRLFTDLEINPGVTLTIKGKVYSANDSKIIVKQGGKLVLDGGTLTTDCACLWPGVEVWGNVTVSQNPLNNSPQGVLEMKNGATIEHAQEAVRLWRPGINWQSGGIIRATDSFFKNNRRAVEFMPYENFLPGNPSVIVDNLSYFSKCRFQTDGPLKCGTRFYAFVTMQKTRGIRFTGNTFVNNAPGPLFQHGYGIYSIDAAYSVEPLCTSVIAPCTSWVSNRFHNLYSAVEANGAADPARLVRVDGCVLSNNYFGITIRGHQWSSVRGNDADIAPGIIFSQGLRLDGSTGYGVEENHFRATTPSAQLGAFVWNSGSANNLIYRNSFTGLYVGTLASDANDGPLTYDGLQLRCNNYSAGKYDIAVGSGSIGLFQGWCNNTATPAGNTFSHNCAQVFPSDIYNGGPQTIFYLHHGTPATTPLCFGPNVLLVNCNASPPSCPPPSSGNSSSQLQNLTAANLQRAATLIAGLGGGRFAAQNGGLPPDGELHSEIAYLLTERQDALNELVRRAFNQETNGTASVIALLEYETTLSILGTGHVQNAASQLVPLYRESGDLIAAQRVLNTLCDLAEWGPLCNLEEVLITLAQTNGTPVVMSAEQLTVVRAVAAATNTPAAARANALLSLVSGEPAPIRIDPALLALAPPPIITTSSLSSNSFTVSFEGLQGATYTLEFKNSLNAATWTTLTTINGIGTVQTLTDPGPLPPTRFYRIRTP